MKVLSKGYSSTIIGVDAYIVEVEVDITHGLPSFTIVGLPEASVRESKERIKSAIANSGYSFPVDRITVNLAPANIKKEGTGFDLPIAVGILAAMEVVPKSSILHHLIFGELSLDGRIKGVRGGLAIALSAKKDGFRSVITPFDIRREAGLVTGINVYPVDCLADLVEFLGERKKINSEQTCLAQFMEKSNTLNLSDFSDVVGQRNVKRALEIAAAGGHNVLMTGPPGSGKSMLAKRLPSILPPLTFEEALETTKIFSVAGLLDKQNVLLTDRPFRSPHHTISDAGLIGGGHSARPGEISLAHNGVLFLDELSEFKRNILEGLRQPLEDRKVTIARASVTITYPSNIMLVGAMNPCPCGYLSDPLHPCSCTSVQIDRYRSKISGPLMDRFDIHVEVPAVPYKEMFDKKGGEASSEIRRRVIDARNIQTDRFRNTMFFCNAQMEKAHTRKWCSLDDGSRQILEKAVKQFGLSARAFHRIVKISRTIADLNGESAIAEDHVAEAIQYRGMNR